MIANFRMSLDTLVALKPNIELVLPKVHSHIKYKRLESSVDILHVFEMYLYGYGYYFREQRCISSWLIHSKDNASTKSLITFLDKAH